MRQSVHVIFVTPVHSQEHPLGGQDWNHAELCLQVQLSHDGSSDEPAEESHSIVDGGVLEGELLSADEVIDAVAFWCREVENHSLLAIRFGYHSNMCRYSYYPLIID